MRTEITFHAPARKTRDAETRCESLREGVQDVYGAPSREGMRGCGVTPPDDQTRQDRAGENEQRATQR